MRRQKQYSLTTLLAAAVLLTALAYILIDQMPNDVSAPVAIDPGYNQEDVQDAIDIFRAK